ncbi:MAG: hypothetical protein M3383_01180 [Actinomycetota bacterium]|nr:hypothetical protein [Actinomycetota bacterium]
MASASRAQIRPWEEVPFDRHPWVRTCGRFFLTFTTELPFEIPLDDQDQWLIDVDQPNELPSVTDNRVTVCLHGSSHPQRIPQHLSVLPNWAEVLAQFRRAARPALSTLCELILEPGPRFEPTDEALTRCFDQGLRALNRILAEYEVVTTDFTIRDLAKEDLPPLAVVTFKDLHAPYYSHTYMRLHPLDGIEKRAMSDELKSKIVDRLGSEHDPVIKTHHWERVRARRLLDQGRYRESVLATATAIESLVAWALSRRSEERDADSRGSVEATMQASIVGVVRTKLSWLGGDWDPGASGTAAHAWKRCVADLRNGIVHRGEQPTYRQAAQAYDSAAEMASYIVDRLRSTGRDAWINDLRIGEIEVIDSRYEWEKHP